MYVQTLRDEDMTPLERAAVSVMVALFVAVEESGSCFDVLVRRAIEEGEITHTEGALRRVAAERAAS